MTAARLPVGTKLGRYEVVKHLARGGMADLSLARASGIQGFERHVVIKHLRPEESEDAQFVEMFLTEARLAGALHHHNIVQVHDIGQEAGRHFFAMEYVHGEDLRRVLSKLASRGEKPAFEHIVAIITAVAAALHHAHEQRGSDRKPLGIVHRDVTPANIIIGYDGSVKVVDFGIAKAAVRRIDTAVGMLKGKVPYMAPEQCSGKPVDRRSDVYGMGVVLYELTTVRRLFKGDNEFYVMSAIIGGDIPPPSKERPDLPQALETIIMKALSRSPVERYQSADEMRIALEAFADAQSLRYSPSGLAGFMKQLFGDRPEPWLAEDPAAPDAQPDFDKTETGLVDIPAEALENRQIPKIATPARGSLIEQARLQTISNEVASKPAPTKVAIDKFVPKDGNAKDKPALPSIKNGSNGSNGKHVKLPGVASVATDVDAPVPRRPAPNPPKLPTEAIARAVEPDALDDPTAVEAELDQHTDLASPPPAPESKGVVAATPRDREQTAIVTPLPQPKPEVGDEPRGIGRGWTFAGGMGMVALTVAVCVVLTSAEPNPPAPRDEVIDLHAHRAATPPPPSPDASITAPVPQPEPEVEAKPVEPEPVPAEPVAARLPEPEPAPEPAPAPEPEPVPAAIEPAPVEPIAKPRPTPRPVAAKSTAKPKPRPRVVSKPKPKPKTPPKKKDPTWDPNALFLKKKP